MKTKTTILSVLLGAAFTAGSLNAAFISETGTFTDTDDSLTLDEKTTSIAGFDSALGTLIGIVVEFTSMTVSASSDIQNTSASSEVAVSTARIGYTGAGGSVLPTLTGPGVAGFTFPAFGGDVDVSLTGVSPIAASGSQPWSGGPVDYPSVLATSVSIAAADFGLYIDTPVTFDVDGVGETLIGSTGGSPQFVNTSLTGSGLVTVTYEYNVIPEPSTALALGLAGGLFFLRRRRS